MPCIALALEALAFGAELEFEETLEQAASNPPVTEAIATRVNANQPVFIDCIDLIFIFRTY
jgi:hypothetical protein